MTTSTSVCLYFGDQQPGPGQAHLTALDDLDVVLEPYHPLVRDGGFADVFPRARRFVYVNPTTVDPWHLERMTDPPPLIGTDEEWGLPRLDLEDPRGLDHAVATTVAALRCDDGRMHGAFVDDLDRLLPDRADIALEYLARTTCALGHEPAWFLNRGFALWSRVENLDAVLLEDLTPETVAHLQPGAVRWLREEVLPRVRDARARGVRVHALGYPDQNDVFDVLPDDRLRHDLAGLVDTVTTPADRRLHEWSLSR